MEAREFYDDWVEHQVHEGINARHHEIVRALRSTGWRPEHRVLEIGSGVGTLTELVVRRTTPQGSIVAVDLSPRSIEVARKRLARFERLELLAGNVLELDLAGPFDVIVLPDVIEHIPVVDHPRLFGRLASLLDPHGFILLNYPNPFHTEWCQVHHPEVLQVIDQPIHADHLVGAAYPHGLYLHSLRTYSIWKREGDYVSAVFKPRPRELDFSEAAPGRFSRARDGLERRLRRR